MSRPLGYTGAKWDKRSAEVWERRPGSRWMPVHSGQFSSMDRWVRRRAARGESARFSHGPTEYVVLLAGEHPHGDTVPTAVIEDVQCPASE